MNKLMRKSGWGALLVAALTLGSCAPKYSYETVPNDPLKARIYTLDNGLKVYMSVNKEEPRIQTYIAVRVGGKNDPAETTGLAHYFEHLMFKGTKQYGTQNYEAEKPLLDQIEQQFEVYRKTTDEAQRKAIYHVIDSLSQEASKYAIPNEYDKLMSAIGANGTNAYTSFDVTCYTEDIPSNQVENWARIQADRFQNAVIRGFHTELETVYEEKNMSLTRDSRKILEKVLSALFPGHPYGAQTVLGTQEHLKNPSITNIKEYYKKWYVPNNMAICLSGDFDPDQMIATIDKHFGGLKPNPELPKLTWAEEQEITSPVVREVYGLDAENICLAWRFPGAAHEDAETLDVVSSVLHNGQAGLFDLNLNQQQKTLHANCQSMSMADYSIMLMQGSPKKGQTLDEVKDLMLAELAKLRAGEFDEKMLEANINNFKLYQQRKMDNNRSRADYFVDAFVNGSEWADEVGRLDRISKLTKEDVVAFANKYLKDENCAIIYKRQGKDPNEKKIDKPAITPIVMNRDTASAFLREIQAAQVAPIEPVFLDFNKDLTQLTAKAGIPVIYKQNTTNDIFQLTYLFDMGNRNDKALGTAADYLQYLGTSDMTPEEVKSEFYRMACRFSVRPSTERTYLTLTGLNENLPQAIALFEKLLADAQVNAQAYADMVSNELKYRHDAKLNQGQNFSRLGQFLEWGNLNPATYQLSEKELKEMNPQQLVDRIHALNGYKHRITYYGPTPQEELLSLINKEHRTPETLADVPEGIQFKQQITDETKVFVAPYDAKQIYMAQVSNNGDLYDPAFEPGRLLYNGYFSGGMNGIVFQEMRESRGLAYTARARLEMPDYAKYSYSYNAFIATQTDKTMDAIATFNDIIFNMPASENAFKLAKESMIARLRTERIIKGDVISTYIDALDMGQTEDSRIKIYEMLQTATLQDVIDFQQKWVKGRKFHYGILGNKKDLDMEALKKIGPIVELTTEDLFGY
ncbi:MAG: insulinase family protein [Bacteroides sp.]|nr:insulinase family protein [Bacteroides sp.]